MIYMEPGLSPGYRHEEEEEGKEGLEEEEEETSPGFVDSWLRRWLRLHPPATLLLPRETMRDTTICGYDVPANTRVFVNAWAIGRDPASWPAPEEFNPDRFVGSDVDYYGSHFELIPFGAGRRICPGLAMGETNVTFTLANLLYCFDWALPAGMKPEDVSMEETGALTFHRKTPLVVVPTKYQRRAA